MNNNLKITIGGTDYLFTEGGSVLNAASGTPAGRWHADSDQPDSQNHLLYDLNGMVQPPLQADYRFNDANQLVVTVRDSNAGVAQTATTTFPGRIHTDDSKDIVYDIFDGSGNATGQSITLYGKLRFDTPFLLVIDLQGGGQAMIRANDTQAPIEANQAASIDAIGADRLDFKASTVNTFLLPTGQEVRAADADIGFDGQWRLDSDGLKFACDATGDGQDQQVVLGLAGKYKGVSAGLQVTWESAGQVTAQLVVEGAHTFDSGSATWNLAIGYTQLSGQAPAVSAKASGAFSHTTKGGNNFLITGTLNASTSDAGNLALDLSLDATYKFTGGQITFSAVAAFAGSQLTYDLKLAGQLQFLGGKLTFTVDYGSDQSASLEVNYDGSADSFFKYFNLKFTRDASGNISFGINFSIEFTYENGVLRAAPFVQN